MPVLRSYFFFRPASSSFGWRSVGLTKGTPMSFDTLGLDTSFLSTLAKLGYTEPSAVQREAIPAVLGGGDLLVSSQTGSGKTAAFMLPGLQRLQQPSAVRGIGPRMLVLAP